MYLALVLVLPLVSLIASYAVYSELEVQKTMIGRISTILFLFVNLPIYFIYARMVIMELFPVSGFKAFYLFIPLIVSFLMLCVDNNYENIWKFLIVGSLPLFIGLNLVFFIGLLMLIYQNSVGESPKALIGRWISTFFLILIIFTPAVHFLLLGIEIHSQNVSGFMKFKELFVYIFTILLMSFFHYKIVINLYHKGML